jgi:hypothetical protein
LSWPCGARPSWETKLVGQAFLTFMEVELSLPCQQEKDRTLELLENLGFSNAFRSKYTLAVNN